MIKFILQCKNIIEGKTERQMLKIYIKSRFFLHV